MRIDGFPANEKIQRAEAWVAAWRAVQTSTARVDRDRAERAMTALYRERGLASPKFVWAQNPGDGLMAWHLASHGREPLRNPYTRGDTGTGTNRALYQLQHPFGLDPAWTYRALRRAQDLAPAGQPGGFRFDGSYSANGTTVRRRLSARVDAHLDAQREATAQTAQVELARSAQTESLARLVIGQRWESLSELVGEELLVDVAVRAVVRSTQGMLDTRASQGEGLMALTLPQFDQVTVAMGALGHVLGAALWRQLDERAARTAMVERRLELARSTAGFWALEDLAIMLDRPIAAGFDERGRLHHDDGPALAYGDGTALWSIHGVEVPSAIVTDPSSITVAAIDAETNAEVRRVMTERFGPERLIREGGARLADEDETGRLWVRSFPGSRWRPPEPLVMVEVQNATPEPDGSVRTYFLRVPPTITSARAAVAWTFGLDGSSYVPALET